MSVVPRIKISNESVREEYIRHCSQLNADDLQTSRKNITLTDVLDAHFLIADYFYTKGHGMGGVGPKDLNLLQSAIHRQYSAFGGHQKWNTPLEVCASLLYGLVKNHPFFDANKRTAFLCLLHNLSKIGRVPTISKNQFEDFLVDIVDLKIRKKKNYNEFKIRYTDDDADIMYIADFLRKNTRVKSNDNRSITYQQLNTILQRHGFTLKDPKGNSIAIYKLEGEGGVLHRIIHRPKVLGHIGFPSWKRQVSKTDLIKAREITGLTEQNGYDLEAFLGYEEPLKLLIEEYHDQLVSLADR